MKIYVGQLVSQIANLEENSNKIKEFYLEALAQKADICMLPELFLPNYMARDLFLYQSFIDNIIKYNNIIAQFTKETCLLLPTITKVGGDLFNSVIALQNGEIIGSTDKAILPNYGIFEESRYFKPGKSKIITLNNGMKIGVPICADTWSPEICCDLKEQGAELFLVPNASPFESNKFAARAKILEDRYNETQIPIIYCNQILAQDGIIFEGRSIAYDGKIKVIGDSFKETRSLIDFKDNKFHLERIFEVPNNIHHDYLSAMILGVREYVKQNGFHKVLIGISGGIDSALVAYIAVKALGKDNVKAYFLPSLYTSDQSRVDAQDLANNLSIELLEIEINSTCEVLQQKIGNIEESSITHQNIQSRVRGTILMAIANKLNALLLTTGNKSEYAVGYATLYGDMNGAFNPIKDLYKTEIYKIAQYINQDTIIIPESIIKKEPSAELTHDQKDSDSLPPYHILDPILRDYIENRLCAEALKEKYPEDLVDSVVLMVNRSEFKRRQSAPGVKLSNLSFDLERRMPLTL